jgi:putative endonuclease
MAEPPQKCWYLYVLECVGGSLYTGIAIDVEQRFNDHLAGKGARYTRMHKPLRIIARFPHANRAEASRAENLFKQLSPTAKRARCVGHVAPA